jgi:peptide/nickel transport system permease protein
MNKGINWKRWYILIFALYSFIGLFNSTIANNKPLIAIKDKSIYLPAMNDFMQDIGIYNETKIYDETIKYDWQLNPLIPYKATQPDVINPGFKSPSFAHLFGTDQVGRDVLAGVIRGCYTSFRIGIFGTLLCGFLGIILGIASGYFQNDGLKLNIIQIFSIFGISLFSIFYFIFPIAAFKFYPLINFIVAAIIIYLILQLFERLDLKKYSVPLDDIINKIIEIRKSIPSLIIVLACLPLFTKPSIYNVILLIALLGWTNFARHARAETLSIKQREYVQAAKIMGASFIHILRHHILPNIGATILTLAISSFTSNILLESTLSFLGIGLPPTEVSWGTMIAESRKNFNAWWMFIFPGLTLIILVFSLNYFSSKYLSERD